MTLKPDPETPAPPPGASGGVNETDILCGIEDHFTITHCFKKGCTNNQGGECLARQNQSIKFLKRDNTATEKQKVSVIQDQVSEAVKMLERVHFKSGNLANDNPLNEKVVDLIYDLENVMRELSILANSNSL